MSFYSGGSRAYRHGRVLRLRGASPWFLAGFVLSCAPSSDGTVFGDRHGGVAAGDAPGAGGGVDAGPSSGPNGSGPGSSDFPVFEAGVPLAGGGGVPQTCSDAVRSRSYIGCEYWPTVTLNSELFPSFPFAVAAANPTDTTAQVEVDRGGNHVATASVEPGKLSVIELPWVPELKQSFGQDGSSVGSALARGGAYHVTSSVPITLYQFNPLEFELKPAPQDCPLAADVGGCYSYTNDASLLLPTTALRNEYYVIAYPTHHYSVRPALTNPFGGAAPAGYANLAGFVAITAAYDGTEVTIHSTANVRRGNGIDPIAAGATATYKLDHGDVALLATAPLPDTETPLPPKMCTSAMNGQTQTTMCPSPAEFDLTGSRITSDKPISVIGGHDCTMIPYNAFACDHIEESLLPVETLGRDLIVTAPVAASGDAADAMYVRVLSAADGNHLTFDPPAVSGPVVLDAGKWVEIGPLTQDFRVLADDKIMVAEFMVGANSKNPPAPSGDPSESLAIPTEQYRLSYTFYAPGTYAANYVNVVAPAGSTIKIDGAPIPSAEFVKIGSTGFGVARHRVGGGAHGMSGDRNFGIVVYGYGRYTSYMYPGGLNLETIKIAPK
jgi:hypothetical protein